MISRYTSIIISFLCIFSLLFFITKSPAAVTCLAPKEECIEGQGETRDFDGFTIDPSCWRKRFIYECHENADNNCQLLRDQKCSQISAKGKITLNGVCVVQDETYNCPVKKCDIKNIPCGKDVFCIGSSCASTNPVRSTEKDVGKALSQLSALNEIASQVKE